MKRPVFPGPFRRGLRRLGAAGLAAGTLWAVVVTAGSDSASAAWAALRAASPLAALKWELGDLWAADSLPLPVLTVLRQSPMLLAAETQVTQAETPRNAEEPPSPAPVETPEGPTTEQTENTGGQGESRPLSVVAADENGYTRVGDVFIKNSSRQTVEGIVFDGTFAAALGEDAPQVLIVHTHTTEAYAKEADQSYDTLVNARTLDEQYNMIRVGDAVAEVLRQNGIQVIHDTTVNDYPSYNGAYDRMKAIIETNLAQYPSIRMVLDIHRDAAADANGDPLPLTATFSGEDYAQVMLVVGTDEGGLPHPNWQQNLSCALKLQALMNRDWPGLCRDLDLRRERFNQNQTPGSLLVEFGTDGNTLSQALRSAEVFGQSLSQLLQAQLAGE